MGRRRRRLAALADPAATAASLERLHRHPRFCVRHLVHADPRPEFLDTAPVRESLRQVAGAGLPLDVPDAYPRHLTQTARLAEELPDLVVVVDHLAKPPLGRPEMGEWRAQLRRVAQVPTTVAKVSGLRAPGAPYTAGAVRPAWDAALELFGPERLMFGSDVTVPEDRHGPQGYRPTYEVLADLIGKLSADEQRAILGETARRSLPAGRRPRAGQSAWTRAERPGPGCALQLGLEPRAVPPVVGHEVSTGRLSAS